MERHAISLKVSRLNMVRGVRSGILPPEEALAHAFTPEETAFLERQAFNAIQGTPDEVRRGLEAVASDFATDDLGVVTICYDFAARVRSYELVAEVCGIAPA